MMAVVSLTCWLFLLLVVVTTHPFSQSVHTIYLIRPNTSTPCQTSTDRCLTLQEFAEELKNTTTDITLELMSGVHNLSTNVVVESIQSFLMHPLFREYEVEVTCSTSAGLKFRNISKFLSVKQITYSFCGDLGAILIESVSQVHLSQITIKHSPGPAMIVNNVSFLNVNSTTIRDGNATGLNINDCNAYFTGNNVFMYNSGGGLSALTSCLYFNGQNIFEGNIANTGGGMNLFNSTVELSGWTEFASNTAVNSGGAINMLYGSMNISGVANFSRNTCTARWCLGGAISASHTNIFNISGNATFERNQAFNGGAVVVILAVETVQLCGIFSNNSARDNGSGGAIAILGTTSAVQLVGSIVFDGNSAREGGAIFVFKAKSFNLTGSIVFSGNKATYGSAMWIVKATLLDLSGWILIERNRAYANTIYIRKCKTIVTQGELTIQTNVAKSGCSGMHFTRISHLKLNGKITFLNNSGYSGVLCVHYVTSAELSGSLTLVGNFEKLSGSIIINNANLISREFSAILLTNNHAYQGGGIFLYKSTLSIQSGTFIADNNLARVSGGAVCSYASNVTLNATVKFISNSAGEGGAYYQTGESRLILGSKANVLFSDNRAEEEGGAIFAVDDKFCSFAYTKGCFFHFTFENSSASTDVKTYFMFKNNSAAVAGNILYGGRVEKCHFRYRYHGDSQTYNFYNISNISDSIWANNLTTIASDPYKVCPCINGTLQCSINTIALTPIYPGQTFKVAVAAVGQENGTVPSSVIASFGLESTASVNMGQVSQTTAATCTSLTYTIFSQNKDEKLKLAVVEKCPYITQSLYLKISILQCPRGFELSGSPAQCKCQERLLEYTQICTIDDQKIHRTSNFWLGYDNAIQGLVLHPYCPFDYCTPPPNNFTIENSDLQCSYNRTRLLCGQCQPHFSLALGTSRCLKCSNYYLALLPMFAIAGLALVVFLFVCRFTVARGTINGLIFYSNIVHSNRTIFFPVGKSNILTVFLAWLNLDLGLETCFYNGMDTYVRAWLQFAFPLYVLVLCGCIVFISSKSYRMSRILGTNPVAVLATLFLLSYTKLLHTAFTTLSFTTLSYPGHNTKLVWLYDANIQYLHGKHIPLFVVGLAALLLCLPYTFLLLTSQWLHAWSNHCLFHWVNSPRLKFFLDAHNAPFKTKHCYWTGLLLLTRLVLYLVYSVNVLGNGSVNLLATGIAVAGLAVWMGVSERPYKSRLLGAIEYLFLLNTHILCVSTLYIRSAQGRQAAVSYTSTALSLVMFVTILLYHGYLWIKRTSMWKTLVLKIQEKAEFVNLDKEDDELMVASRRITHSEIMIPRHTQTGYSERMPASQMTKRDIQQQNTNSVRQPLQQCERAAELSGSMDSCSSLQSWDNLSTPYTEAELREPLLSSDDTS